MDKYKLMRMAENLEEDAIKFDEVDELFPQEGESAEDFKRKYKDSKLLKTLEAQERRDIYRPKADSC